MFIKTSKTKSTPKNEASNSWFDIFEFIIELTNVYQYEKYQKTHNDFRKKNRKNALSMVILADLNEKWK